MELFGFALDAVALGFLGFGALIFVMAFLILMANKPVDEAGARFRGRFLTLGFSSFVFAGLLTIIQPFLPSQSSEKIADPSLMIDFSPSMVDRKLPAPTIYVSSLDGTVGERERFKVADGAVIDIKTDKLIEHISALSQTAQEMTATAQKLVTQQENELKALSRASNNSGVKQRINSRLVTLKKVKTSQEKVADELRNNQVQAAADSAKKLDSSVAKIKTLKPQQFNQVLADPAAFQ